MTSSSLESVKLRHPGHSKGLIEVPRWWFLLRLLVRKELRVRYRGSVLGMVWTYVKPAVQLTVYYLAMGKFMNFNERVDNYVFYLFSGMVIVNLFNEILRNTTGSIVWNGALVGKIYLPRELFPVSSVWVAFIHFLPQVAVLFLFVLVQGWHPGLSNIVNLFAGVLLVTIASLGLGLMFAAWNVMFRDAENLVELIGMVVMWLTPVFYPWTMVHTVIGGHPWLWALYESNPLVLGTELFHSAFWAPTSGVSAEMSALPAHFTAWTAASFATAVALLLLGQLVFRHHEAKFAQEL
ncbi:MAG: ABC transporter permease [Propionibacteriaceae bacterium]|nr:ABC transporter permease [Propionibacteriaceae bacterium]